MGILRPFLSVLLIVLAPRYAVAQFSQAMFGNSPELAEGFLELCRNIPNPIGYLDAIQQKEACRELAVGEHKVVDLDYFESPTNTVTKHVLRRIDANTHQIEFNLDFKDAGKRWYHGANKTPSEVDLRKRVNECVEEMNEFLVGPTGERIKLKVLGPKELSKEHKGVHTTIHAQHDKDFRANSVNYPLNISCSTVAHELLHLAGLPDEYSEKTPWNTQHFRCRAVANRPSIMGNSWMAYEIAKSVRAKERSGVSYRSCICHSASGCTGAMHPNGCRIDEEFDFGFTPAIFDIEPDEAASFAESLIKMAFSSFGALAGQPGPAIKSTVRLGDVKVDRLPGVLMGAHVRAIKNPGCRAKNTTYYKCSTAWQGQSKKEKFFGTGDSCPLLPPECYKQSWLD